MSRLDNIIYAPTEVPNSLTKLNVIFSHKSALVKRTVDGKKAIVR